MISDYYEVPEDDRVELWKMEQFGREGFEFVDALKLVAWDADTHRVHELLAHGCSHELAVRILTPDHVTV